jgi:hypothetical protein
MELQNITIQHFSSILDSDLSIQFTDEITLPASVVEVTQLNGYSPLERIPFSVIFRTNQKNEYYSQGTYVVHHPEINEIIMFLSPKGFDEKGMKYEAVFS